MLTRHFAPYLFLKMLYVLVYDIYESLSAHACNFNIYVLMLNRPSTESAFHVARRVTEAVRVLVCLTQQTWAKLSIHREADWSIDGISLLFTLFPASDGHCDWNNTIVICACWVARRLYYNHISLGAAWTGGFVIFYQIWQREFYRHVHTQHIVYWVKWNYRCLYV